MVVSKEIETEVDKFSRKLDAMTTNNLKIVSNKSVEYIQELNKLILKANERFESFYHRKKIIDYLIYANLVITPILFLIIVYIVFIK